MRFRVDYPLPGLRRRGDIVFPARRVVVFVDGCFWHGCPEHGTWPRENSEWWRAKLEANIARDRDADSRLGELGWVVLRFWEHDEPQHAAIHVAAVVHDSAARRSRSSGEPVNGRSGGRCSDR